MVRSYRVSDYDKPVSWSGVTLLSPEQVDAKEVRDAFREYVGKAKRVSGEVVLSPLTRRRLFWRPNEFPSRAALQTVLRKYGDGRGNINRWFKDVMGEEYVCPHCHPDDPKAHWRLPWGSGWVLGTNDELRHLAHQVKVEKLSFLGVMSQGQFVESLRLVPPDLRDDVVQWYEFQQAYVRRFWAMMKAASLGDSVEGVLGEMDRMTKEQRRKYLNAIAAKRYRGRNGNKKGSR